MIRPLTRKPPLQFMPESWLQEANPSYTAVSQSILSSAANDLADNAIHEGGADDVIRMSINGDIRKK